MSQPPESVIIKSYRFPIKAGKVTLQLSHDRKVLGFAPPAPPTDGHERLNVISRRTPTAALLVQEATNGEKSDISFEFVKSSTPFMLANGHSCLGSAWNTEDGHLYHLIGIAEPTCLGEACGLS